MTYIKIILTIIAVLLLFITYRLAKNPMDVNIKYIDDRIVEVATPINVRVVK